MLGALLLYENRESVTIVILSLMLFLRIRLIDICYAQQIIDARFIELSKNYQRLQRDLCCV